MLQDSMWRGILKSFWFFGGTKQPMFACPSSTKIIQFGPKNLKSKQAQEAQARTRCGALSGGRVNALPLLSLFPRRPGRLSLLPWLCRLTAARKAVMTTSSISATAPPSFLQSHGFACRSLRSFHCLLPRWHRSRFKMLTCLYIFAMMLNMYMCYWSILC